jgi:glycosyltransferase involved in cell wall biosynthesis
VRVLFYHADRGWSGRARAFAAAARGLAERGYHVTFVCQPESGVERRLSGAGYDIIPLSGRPGMRLGLRMKRLMRERFIEVAFAHTEREHLSVALGSRLAERGAAIRRLGAGEDLSVGRRARMALRLAASGALLTRLDDEPAAIPPYGSIGPVWADLGIDVTRHDTVTPIARSLLRAGGDARVLVCVCDGRTARGAVATVLRAVALLAPRHPELRLVLIGGGSDDEDIRIHAAALGIAKTVIQLGERDDELSVLRTADAGLVIASGDTAAFAHLDLMALRIPALAERSPIAIRYVADGITGILLPPGDPPATAATLATFLAHDAQRTAMGNAARARVAREFPESAMIDGFVTAVEAARDRGRWLR